MTLLNRRSFIKSAPVAALTASTATTAVPDMGASERIAHHVNEITRIMRETAPEGSKLKGFQFTILDDEVNTDSIWGSAITEDYRLAHMRPGVFDGWRETKRVIS